MNKTSNCIWQQFTFSNNTLPTNVILKKSHKIKICIQDSSTSNDLSYEKNQLKRKKGRRKFEFLNGNDLALHTKDNDDNIKRKVKTHFHNFIVAYLNMQIKNTIKTKRLYKFRKMSSKITQDITISFNKKLLDTPIKDILIQVSQKFKNKDINLHYIEKINQIKGNNTLCNENIYNLNEMLNISYKEMMNNFYLKSTKKMFENENIDESFERHIENMINKYGYNYALKFKQNAENFVNFYMTSKQRCHKMIHNNNSDNNNDNINKKEQNDINILKLSLDDEGKISNSKCGKKFFEIIKDNPSGDISKCNSTQTQSSAGSSDDSSDKDDNEKEVKILLKKKRFSNDAPILLKNDSESK